MNIVHPDFTSCFFVCASFMHHRMSNQISDATGCLERLDRRSDRLWKRLALIFVLDPRRRIKMCYRWVSSRWCVGRRRDRPRRPQPYLRIWSNGVLIETKAHLEYHHWTCSTFPDSVRVTDKHSDWRNLRTESSNSIRICTYEKWRETGEENNPSFTVAQLLP